MMSDKIKAIVVDDEEMVRLVLTDALKSIPSIEIVGEAASVPEAIKCIQKHKPELVFLDIEMPQYSGLQLLDFFDIDQIQFEIIFVTAYDQYAIEAFKLSAFDYLLKPIDESMLQATIERYEKRRNNHLLAERATHFNAVYQKEQLPERIAVSSLEGITFIQLSDIVLLEASGTYTTIYKTNNTKIVASKPLGEFETMLSKDANYFRPHRSFLINLTHIEKLETTEGDIIYMTNQVQVPLSRYKKKEFLEMINEFRV